MVIGRSMLELLRVVIAFTSFVGRAKAPESVDRVELATSVEKYRWDSQLVMLIAWPR